MCKWRSCAAGVCGLDAIGALAAPLRLAKIAPFAAPLAAEEGPLVCGCEAEGPPMVPTRHVAETIAMTTSNSEHCGGRAEMDATSPLCCEGKASPNPIPSPTPDDPSGGKYVLPLAGWE